MVYIFLAEGFEEIETLSTADILRRAKTEVKLCSVADTQVTGSHGVCVTADCLINDIELQNAEMLVLPGGTRGTDNLGKCEKLMQMLKKAEKEDIYIAAICAAPSILGRLGILQNRRAVCYPGYERFLEGANFQPDESVVCDRRVITSRAAGTANDFALKLVELLKGYKTADRICNSIYYKRDEHHLD